MLKTKKMMEMSSLLMLTLITKKMMSNFKNKLMILILMEAFFLITLMNQLSNKSKVTCMVMLMNIMIFMVMDSTMGISILISSSRNSAISMQQFSKI